MKDQDPRPLREKLQTEYRIAEGKTKIIFGTGMPEFVLIKTKDDITAGDGAKRDLMSGKGPIATETTVNVFKYLSNLGIPTHFVDTYSPDTFIAKRVKMIPVESVARRIATGSYLKRNPEVAEGTRFEGVVTELFYKDDEAHDPKMGFVEGNWVLTDAKRPKGEEGSTDVRTTKDIGLTDEQARKMGSLTREVFLALEEAWANQGLTLVDLKIEFGIDPLGKLIVADVIDNDSWRIWRYGNGKEDLSKQVYRDTPTPTPDDWAKILRNYKAVAGLTGHFLD